MPQACAAFLVAGCAGAVPVQPEGDPRTAEIRELRKQNEAFAARLDALSSRVDLLTARATTEAEARQAPTAGDATASAPVAPPAAALAEIPRDLAVVKVAPEPARPSGARGTGRLPSRSVRAAPPVPTSVPIQEPDPAAVDALGVAPRRPLAVEAERELRDARAQAGLSRAHALEDFTGHYPQHPSADNALVEAAAAYDAAGVQDASCALSRRVLDEYPAGDAQSEALERLAACEARRGSVDAEQRLLARLRADFPGTPAARRAEARLSQDSGRGAETVPRDVPARSSP